VKLAPHRVQEHRYDLNCQIHGSSWLNFCKAFICCHSNNETGEAYDNAERIVEAHHVVDVDPVDTNKHRGEEDPLSNPFNHMENSNSEDNTIENT